MLRYLLEALTCVRNQSSPEGVKTIQSGVSISIHAHAQEDVAAQVTGGSAGLAAALAIERWISEPQGENQTRNKKAFFSKALFTGVVTVDGRVSCHTPHNNK